MLVPGVDVFWVLCGMTSSHSTYRIPDPDAVKPEDWDEDAPQKIPDPDATKPEGWLDDGPEMIPDPDAEMPEDWYGGMGEPLHSDQVDQFSPSQDNTC